MKGITDIAGFRVGHATSESGLTGCTVVLCPEGTVGGVDVRGYATGASELGVLDPAHIAPFVHALVLAGGSAFGLEAACGVRRALAKQGVGLETGAGVVPIVPAAILYDLALNPDGARPDLAMGERAVRAAHEGPVEEGNAGAGAGATVGKIFGLQLAMKGGIGSASMRLDSGVTVAALVAVNALGDVRDPATGVILAGARKDPASREFANSSAAILRQASDFPKFRGNTTLAIVATDAAFDRVETTKLAALAGLGLVRTIAPVNTSFDGDITFALASGRTKASVDAVGIAAADVLAEAVMRAVRAAKSVAGVPGLSGHL
jgi:L-aminopeptidase/D-esterase-like protein